MSGCPPFIGMTGLRELFPNRPQETIWRWNTKRGGRYTLPPSDLDFGQRDPAWTVHTISEWAERTGLIREMDPDAVDRILSVPTD